MSLSGQDWESRLRVLEREYAAFRKTMFARMISVILILLTAVQAFGAVFDVLSGTQRLVIFLTLAGVVIIYFLGKAARRRAEITKTQKLMEMRFRDRTG